ncbi:hypothetical protein VTK56DRAFT_1899 [Thermocarpiscus australiensis]
MTWREGSTAIAGVGGNPGPYLTAFSTRNLGWAEPGDGNEGEKRNKMARDAHVVGALLQQFCHFLFRLLRGAYCMPAKSIGSGALADKTSGLTGLIGSSRGVSSRYCRCTASVLFHVCLWLDQKWWYGTERPLCFLMTTRSRIEIRWAVDYNGN